MKKILEDIKKVFESKTSFRILCAIGIVIVVLFIFAAGFNVGFHKASFGHAWEENYERNFGVRTDYPIFGKDNFPNAHGAIGGIIKVELPTIIVQDKDNTEKVVLIGDDTKIQQGSLDIKMADLKIDDFVVVIGAPDDKGIIEAKFIRVMPLGMPVAPPPQTTPAPTK